MTRRGKLLLACCLWLVFLTFVASVFAIYLQGPELILLAAAWAALAAFAAAPLVRAVKRRRSSR
jgi:predicted PurR-regulated permease PerM